MQLSNITGEESQMGVAHNAAPSLYKTTVCYSEDMPMDALAVPYLLPNADTVHTDSLIELPYLLRVRDMEEHTKPREKLIAHGPKDLSMAELVAVLLGVGTRREEVMSMAYRIVQEYGERAVAAETDPRRLSQALDIPLHKACQIVASFEMGRRYYQKRSGKPVCVRTASQAYQYLRGMAELSKEQLRALYLNSRYQVIHEEIVSMGSLTANIVHPREVYQPAIVYGAAAVVVAHNHPSGSLEATAADHEVTQQLRAAGLLLGIELLDHLIVTTKGYKSIGGA